MVGATAIVSQVRAGARKHAFASWVAALLTRKAPKLVAVALANKLARIAWKLMVSGESYDRQRQSLRTAAT